MEYMQPRLYCASASPSSASLRISDNGSAGFGEDRPARMAASPSPRATRPDRTFERLIEGAPFFGLTWSWDSPVARAWPLVWLRTRIASWPTQSVLERQPPVRPADRGP